MEELQAAWDALQSTPSYVERLHDAPEPTEEQEAEDAKEPTITIILYEPVVASK